jgi:hypothetical protein
MLFALTALESRMCADSHRASLSGKTRRDTRAFGELDNLIYLLLSLREEHTRLGKHFGERTRSGRKLSCGCSGAR